MRILLQKKIHPLASLDNGYLSDTKIILINTLISITLMLMIFSLPPFFFIIEYISNTSLVYYLDFIIIKIYYTLETGVFLAGAVLIITSYTYIMWLLLSVIPLQIILGIKLDNTYLLLLLFFMLMIIVSGNFDRFVSPLLTLYHVITQNKNVFLKIIVRCIMVKITILNLQYILLPLVIAINPTSIFTNLAIICNDNFFIFIALSLIAVNTFNLNKIGSLYYPVFNTNISKQQISVNVISISLGYVFWNSILSTNYVQHIIHEVETSVSNIYYTKLSSYTLFDSYLAGYFVLMEQFGFEGLFTFYDYGEGPSGQGGPTPNQNPNENVIMANTQNPDEKNDNFVGSYPTQLHLNTPKTIIKDLVEYTETRCTIHIKSISVQPLAYEDLSGPILHNLTNNYTVWEPLKLIKANQWRVTVKGDNLYRSYTQGSYGRYSNVSKHSNYFIKFDNTLNSEQALSLYRVNTSRYKPSLYEWQNGRVRLYVNPMYPDEVNIHAAKILNTSKWALCDSTDILCKKLEVIVKSGIDWAFPSSHPEVTIKQLNNTNRYILVSDYDKSFLNKTSPRPSVVAELRVNTGFRLPLSHDVICRMRSRALNIKVNNADPIIYKVGLDETQYIWIPHNNNKIHNIKTLTITEIKNR